MARMIDLNEQAKRMAPELAAIVMAELLDESPGSVKRKYIKHIKPEELSIFWTELALVCLQAGLKWQEKVTDIPQKYQSLAADEF